MKTLHEVRIVTLLKKLDGTETTKVVAALQVNGIRLAMAMSTKDVGTGAGMMSPEDVKEYVAEWKKYARLHNFIFHDETVAGEPRVLRRRHQPKMEKVQLETAPA